MSFNDQSAFCVIEWGIVSFVRLNSSMNFILDVIKEENRKNERNRN